MVRTSRIITGTEVASVGKIEASLGFSRSSIGYPKERNESSGFIPGPLHDYALVNHSSAQWSYCNECLRPGE
jgi:hypothetical protein